MEALLGRPRTTYRTGQRIVAAVASLFDGLVDDAIARMLLLAEPALAGTVDQVRTEDHADVVELMRRITWFGPQSDRRDL
jgi:hypothetical protein